MHIKRFALGIVVSVFSFALIALAQQTGSVATVEVTASTKEAEVGQQVKLTAVAKDANGQVLSQKPETFFAGPFDAATADENGVLKLHGPGEVIAGAIFAGAGNKPVSGFTKIVVKPA